MIKKAIREYLQADTQISDNVKNVFTFFNTANGRRVNNTLSKNTFPMITINEVERDLSEVHEAKTFYRYSGQIEIQLDTIVDAEACNDKLISKLNDTLDKHEETAERIFTLLHRYTGDMNGVFIYMSLFQNSGDSQLIYNLVNNDKDQTVYRKTLIFNINYKTGI